MATKRGSNDAWAAIRNSPGVHSALYAMAVRVRDAAESWVQSKPHTREHPPPNFEVRKGLGRNRARYTIHPITPFAVYQVAKDPAGFAACLEAGRG